MEITLPDSVRFIVYVGDIPTRREVCFTHAVKHAIVGRQVKTELTDYYAISCDDCEDLKR